MDTDDRNFLHLRYLVIFTILNFMEQYYCRTVLLTLYLPCVNTLGTEGLYYKTNDRLYHIVTEANTYISPRIKNEECLSKDYRIENYIIFSSHKD